jgi:hypothetical protein
MLEQPIAVAVAEVVVQALVTQAATAAQVLS